MIWYPLCQLLKWSWHWPNQNHRCLTLVHYINKWSTDSKSPQKWQSVEPLHPLLTRLDLVKIFFLCTSHIKTLILGGNLRFHTDTPLMFKNVYNDLTVKSPLLVHLCLILPEASSIWREPTRICNSCQFCNSTPCSCLLNVSDFLLV